MLTVLVTSYRVHAYLLASHHVIINGIITGNFKNRKTSCSNIKFAFITRVVYAEDRSDSGVR